MSTTKIRGIFERDKGSGVWWICWFDLEGRRHREKVGPKQLAVDAYRKRKTEVREGKFFPGLRNRGVLFSQLCDDFEKHRPLHWSKGLFDIAKAWFEAVPASAITPQQIDQRLHKLIENGRTAATANRYRAIVSAVFSWAIRNGRTKSNPARAVPLRRENPSRLRFLSDVEERAMRSVLFPEHLPEIELALHTGMRKGNQYGLTWSDVDLKRGIVTLHTTKSGERQHIPLNRAARAALETLKGKYGEKVCGQDPRYWFKRALKAAGITGFRWHDLRHTFASRLVMAGVDLRTVQELCGHKNISMTVRYAHLSPRHTREAIERLSSSATRTATASKTQHRKKSASA